jgi:transposase
VLRLEFQACRPVKGLGDHQPFLFTKSKAKVMEEMLIVGVDVSKSTLDIFLMPLGVCRKIKNSQPGFNQWLKELKKISSPSSKLLIVMEHTGQYSHRFELFLRSQGIDYCKIAALEIKRSLGIVRGKSDKVDARRIANYGWLRKDILTADPGCHEEIWKLKNLLSLRAMMVRHRSGYLARLKEMKASGTCKPSDLEIQLQQQMIDFLSKKISLLQKQIQTLINTDQSLSKTSELLRSIKGVGWITAAYMIGCTENFKRFSNARKFNCYAGLAPFKHESGSSIKGKTRLSHLANKQAKALLNLAASSAIQYNPEMKAYYQKRVAEGKRKMSCLNIIRSKLVARMFAVIKRQSPYQQVAPAA